MNTSRHLHSNLRPRAVVTAAAVFIFTMAPASAAPPDPGVRDYMVSALLRQSGTGLSIRLVHGIAPGRSEEEASGVFIKRARAAFEGDAVMELLATPVTVTPAPCNRPAPARTWY